MKRQGEKKRKRKMRIIPQIMILVLVNVILIGIISYYTQYSYSNNAVKNLTTSQASNVAVEVTNSIKEYPAHLWLLSYWYENAENLDVEYDVDYETGKKTREKCNLLSEHHPELQMHYAKDFEIERLSEEDQKLYAEIVYSWMTTRINQIKRSYGVDFLFCFMTDTDDGEKPFRTQFFLLSGADPGDERGYEYLQIYPLGKAVSIDDNESQQQVMREAYDQAQTISYFGGQMKNPVGELASAGHYVDYYAYVERIGDQAVMLGMTYDMSQLMGKVEAQTRKGTALTVTFLIILGASIMVHLILFVLRPLRRVTKNIRLYTKEKNSEVITKNLAESLKGRFSFAVRGNEIGELTEDTITLVNEIDDYTERIEEITAEKERIGVELGLASRIQANMLPNKFPAFPDRKEFDLYASMAPAKEVGGDFYDFFLIDDDHLAILIADVSGKGVPAALFMMASMIVIHNMTMIERAPGKALEAANHAICDKNHEEMFVTAWLGVLEISTGKLTCANAGHEYPVYQKAGGSFELLRDKHGFVIGGMDGVRYREYELQLEPGAKLFVYTDGVAEATNSDEELYGTERLVEALQGAEDSAPQEILDTVNQSVQDFVKEAEQFDDLTMLCLEYKGKEE